MSSQSDNSDRPPVQADAQPADRDPSPLGKDSQAGPPQNVLQAVEKRWPTADWCDVHVAVAVSGGADSMALLRAVLEIKRASGGMGRVFVHHVNHHLRGEESDQEQAWLVGQCKALGAQLTVLHVDQTQLAAENTDGMESAARQIRYRLLTQAAEALGARFLATAHTRDDQVETVLFRVLRGSGLRGLRGIPASRPLTESLTLVRPLLDCRRTTLVEYLQSLGQTYQTDSSNSDTRHTRNRLRHKLLPLLQAEYNAEVEDALLRLAAHAENADQCIETLADELLSECVASSDAETLALDVGPLQHQPAHLVCETLRLSWRRAGLPEQSMTYDWWQILAAMAQGPPSPKPLNLPGGVRATLKHSQLRLEQPRR